MEPTFSASVKFSIVIPFNGSREALEKNLSSILKQIERNIEVFIVVPKVFEYEFDLQMEASHFSFKWNKILTNNNDFYLQFIDGIKHIKNGWVAFLKPGDEWYSFHLAVFVEAFKRNPESLAFYGQNIAKGMQQIKRIRRANSQINFLFSEMNELVNISQCVFNANVFQTIILPEFAYPQFGELFFVCLVNRQHPFIRINQFTCKCKSVYSFSDVRTANHYLFIFDFIIRNVIHHRAERIHLLNFSYRKSVCQLFFKAKFKAAGMLIVDYIYYYIGFRKGMNKINNGI